MTRRRKILLAALLCISPVIYWVGREVHKAYLICQVVSMIKEEGLDFTTRREFTIGDNGPTYQYELVTSALGFQFPSGTVVEQCDDMWGHLHTCFTLPVGKIDAILARYEITQADWQPDAELSIQWLEINGTIPASAKAFVLTEPPSGYYSDVLIFAHVKSSRVWVDCGYCPPYESPPNATETAAQTSQ